MPRTDRNKVGSHKTKIYTDDDFTCVKYHNTEVVRFNKNMIILNTGGYYTVTTKVRMNQASHQFSLDFGVFQKDNKWWVTWRGMSLPWGDSDQVVLQRSREYRKEEKKMELEYGKFYRREDNRIAFIESEKNNGKFVANFKSPIRDNKHYNEDGTHYYKKDPNIIAEATIEEIGTIADWGHLSHKTHIYEQIKAAFVTLPDKCLYKDGEIWENKQGRIEKIRLIADDSDPHYLYAHPFPQFQFGESYVFLADGEVPMLDNSKCMNKKLRIVPKDGKVYRDKAGRIHNIAAIGFNIGFRSIDSGIAYTFDGECPGAGDDYLLWEEVEVGTVEPEFDLAEVARIMAEINGERKAG